MQWIHHTECTVEVTEQLCNEQCRHLKHLAVAMEEMMVGVGLLKCQSWKETTLAGSSKSVIEER